VKPNAAATEKQTIGQLKQAVGPATRHKDPGAVRQGQPLLESKMNRENLSWAVGFAAWLGAGLLACAPLSARAENIDRNMQTLMGAELMTQAYSACNDPSMASAAAAMMKSEPRLAAVVASNPDMADVLKDASAKTFNMVVAHIGLHKQCDMYHRRAIEVLR
jgi:hypothetical protein